MPSPPVTDLTKERAREAYNVFRGGFRDNPCPVPHWDDAESWVRDVVFVAYLQGHLDGSWRPQPKQ